MLKATLGSMLPNLTQDEKDLIKGSCDFYAIDGYTGYLAYGIAEGSAACAANSSDPNFPECAGVRVSLLMGSLLVLPQIIVSVGWSVHLLR